MEVNVLQVDTFWKVKDDDAKNPASHSPTWQGKTEMSVSLMTQGESQHFSTVAQEDKLNSVKYIVPPPPSSLKGELSLTLGRVIQCENEEQWMCKKKAKMEDDFLDSDIHMDIWTVQHICHTTLIPPNKSVFYSQKYHIEDGTRVQ